MLFMRAPNNVLFIGATALFDENINLHEVARSASGFINRIDATAQKLDASVTDLRRVVLNGQSLTNLSDTISNMRTVTAEAVDTVNGVNQIITTNGEQINLAVSNIVYFSAELTRLAGSAQDILNTNGTSISTSAKNIEYSTEVLKKLADDLQSGKGLAGTVLQNQQLSTNVQAIVNNLAIASSNLNRLGLWHFLWHKEPLPTNAAPASSHH